MRPFLLSIVMGIGALVATHDVAAQRTGSDAARPAPEAAAVRAANERFAGVWKLVGEETRDATGQVVAGPNANSGGRFGYITYDPAGYMGVVLAWNRRPAFKGKASTPEEARAALSSYNSYWGSFAVNDARGIVTHQTMGAVSPAFAGTNQERGFTIAGNRLTLRPPNLANGDQRSLTWERVPDLPNLTPTHRKLIGFWKLINLERRTANGAVSIANPGMTGFIVYTASGHVMVHMMDPYRRRNVGEAPTADETMATYRTYTSYFGPYTVNEPGGFVVHHLTAAFNSGVEGTEFQRFLEFSGKRLILRPPVTKDGNGETVQTALIWERLSN
jgi:hypothetical protein